ncbi:hypothetical protein ACNFU2_07815 [Chryseobacterium sp. PTM-20240506]|uniref:hypothetical protein n=1 Tax=Chryseobacterium sp. PTM-20240506 TaxID=3400631 RepID=UPI003AAC892E
MSNNQLILDILLVKAENEWVSKEIFFNTIFETLLEIGRVPGIYQIRTNTPISILSQFGERVDKAYYNFQKKIKESLELGSLIIPEDLENGYVVYTGHQAFLRQRCKEHFIGSKGTGCLNIFEFEELRNYRWWFEYLYASSIPNYHNSKLFRTYLEQLHRANIGWPILCSQ